MWILCSMKLLQIYLKNAMFIKWKNKNLPNFVEDVELVPFFPSEMWLVHDAELALDGVGLDDRVVFAPTYDIHIVIL